MYQERLLPLEEPGEDEEVAGVEEGNVVADDAEESDVVVLAEV